MCTRDLEMEMKSKGFTWVIGCDEAGRGCLAGPVVAAACLLPPEFDVKDVKDSKKITSEKKRNRVYEAIVNHPGVIWHASVQSAETIDKHNILQATFLAMCESIHSVQRQAMERYPEQKNSKTWALIDGDKIPPNLKVGATSVVQGDGKCTNIAAASIIAKVTRDRLMVQQDAIYPGWGFADHKGYGCASHMERVRKGEHTPLHRLSFQPLRGALESAEKQE